MSVICSNSSTYVTDSTLISVRHIAIVTQNSKPSLSHCYRYSVLSLRDRRYLTIATVVHKFVTEILKSATCSWLSMMGLQLIPVSKNGCLEKYLYWIAINEIYSNFTSCTTFWCYPNPSGIGVKCFMLDTFHVSSRIVAKSVPSYFSIYLEHLAERKHYPKITFPILGHFSPNFALQCCFPYFSDF